MENNFKKFVLIFINLVGLIIIIKSSMVAAQTTNDNITMSAEPAFSGNYKYGEWLPIWITLSNQGPDMEGSLEVEVSQSGGVITYAKSISLPTGSRKQTSLSILPNNFSRELELKLISNQETVLSKIIAVTPNQNDSILIAIGSQDRGALSLIGNIETGDSFRKVVLFDINIEQIPTKFREMESIDAIVLNDIDTSQLSQDQKRALEAWVTKGGHLIIGGGAGLEKTANGLPENLVKFSSGQTNQIEEIPNLEVYSGGNSILVQGPFTFTTIEPDGGTALITQNGFNFLHQWNIGQGKITLSAIDLSSSPFNAWSGTTVFWETLLSSEIYFPMWMPRDMALRQMRANSMSYPLSNLPALDIPSIKALGILLILYIIAIGPVNYFILKWKNNFQLAWVTIPVLTILFTAGAFGLAYSLRGNDIVINKLSIIEIGQNKTASIDSYIGIFSPSQTAYEILIEGDQLLSPSFGGYYDPWSSSNFNTSGQATFIQGNPSMVVGLSVNQWSMQSFNVEAINAELGNIESTLLLGKDQISGTLKSRLPFVIEDAVLIAGQSTVSLGDLVPNQENEINLDIGSENINIFGNPLTYQILETAYPGSSFNYQREFETKRAIMDNYFQPFGYWLGPNLTSNNLTETNQFFLPNIFILGWTTDTPPQVELNGEDTAQNALGLVISQVAIKLGDNEFTIPPTFFNGKIVEQPVNSGYCGSAATNLYMDYGTAKFEFSLPPAISDAVFSDISIFFNEDISQWSQEDPGFTLWIYNWDEEIWVQVNDFTNGLNKIDNPTGLINQDGIILIQVDKENKNTGGCVYLGLGLEGRND